MKILIEDSAGSNARTLKVHLLKKHNFRAFNNRLFTYDH